MKYGLAILLLILAGNCHAKTCERIGLLGEFKSRTGRLSLPFGVPIKFGADAAAKYLGSQNSSRCYEFELLDIDNLAANIPDIIKNATELKYFVGLGISDQALVAREALKSRKAVLFSPTASSDLLNEDGNRIVTMFPRNQQIAHFLATDAIRRKIKDVAIISAGSSTYSSGMAKDFKEQFVASGGKIAKEIQFRTSKMNVQTIADELQSANTAHVFMPLFELDAAQIISFLFHSNINVSFIGSDAWGTTSEVILKLTKEIPFEAVLPSIYDASISTEMNSSFKNLYKDVGGQDIPTDLAAFSFESVLLIDQMRKNCSQSEIENDLRRCLRKSLPFEATTGTINSVEGLNLKRSISLKFLEPQTEKKAARD